MLYTAWLFIIPAFISVLFLISCFSLIGGAVSVKAGKKLFRKGALWGAAFLGLTGIYLIVSVLWENTVYTDFLPPETVCMIDLTGYDYNLCRETYREYFELVVDSEQYAPDIPKGSIISHDPGEGVPVLCDGNTIVRCVVSKGAQSGKDE